MFEIPRPLLREFLERPESKQVGLYFLVGAGETDESPKAYIGQSGNVGSRIQQHTVSKDFWTKVIVAVSLTNEWTSTHVAYLEWLSVRRAVEAGRYELINGNQAINPYTPEPLEADCNEFLETIGVLAATLGTPVLEQVHRRTIDSSSDRAADQDLLYFREAGCNATGLQTSEGILVLHGSAGRKDLRPSAPRWVKRLREALLEQGVYTVQDGQIVFVKDHLFSSPSAAGALLVGGTNNGLISWKNVGGQDLKQIEAIELNAASRHID